MYLTTDDLYDADVIVQGNDRKAWKGKFLGFHSMDNGSNVPMVQDEDGEEKLVFGVILPYRRSVLDLLQSMPLMTAWEYCCDWLTITSRIQENQRTDK